MRLSNLVMLGLLSLLLAACGANGPVFLVRSTLTPTPSPTPTFTPTPTVTPTPSPTPTPLPAARVFLGDNALRNGDWEAALNEYQTALDASADPNVQAAALLGIGRRHYLAGEMEQAYSALARLLQEYPESQQAAYGFFTLAQVFSATERPAEAAQAYSEYLTRRPGVIDGYVLELRGDARFAAGDYLNAAQDFRAALQAGGLLDGTFLEMKEARAYALAGTTDKALFLYEDLYNRSSNENTKALINLRRGQIYTLLGQTDLANAEYLEAVNNFPTAGDSYSALVALVEAGIPVDELNRGIIDYFAGQHGAALAAFNRYLQGDPPDAGTARYYSGLANRELGGFTEAINEWEKLIQNHPEHPEWDAAWEEMAFTQWYYLDQYEPAVQTLLEFVEQSPAHPRAAEFLFDAAQIAERSGDLAQAAELWERVMNHYPGDGRASQALFLSGLARYRQADYAAAYLAFQRLAGAVEDASERSRGYFWSGKAQEKLGDLPAARASWEIAADLDPTGYYSERAVDVLRDRQPFTPPAAYELIYDPQHEQSEAQEWMLTTFGLPAGTDFSGLGELVNDPRLLRGKELWEVGLYDEARAEFEAVRQSVTDDPLLTYRLARYFTELGLYRSAALAARQVLTLAGMDDAGTLSAPAYFNYLRFPTYYRELVFSAAEKYGFHPLFLFSLIRQESLFESFVRSSAAARGLMQIIPSTGAEIAKNLGWPPDYTAADLNRPLVNITLGTDYLDTQRSHFDGNLEAALAAYNGGPGNASQWLKLAGDDQDVFLEVIRYPETREYLRRIYEIFNIYRRLYDRSP